MNEWKLVAKEFAAPGGAYMDAAAAECVQRMAEEIARLRADLESWHKGAVAGELSLVRGMLTSERGAHMATLEKLAAAEKELIETKKARHQPEQYVVELVEARKERDAAIKERDALQAEVDAWMNRGPATADEIFAIAKERDAALDRLAASEAREVGLRGALERVLIKVDWNSDEFHNPKQYAETRAIIQDALAATEPPALLVVLTDARAEAARLRGALDRIYNHNEAARAAVIQHYGIHHYPDSSADLAAVRGAVEAMSNVGMNWKIGAPFGLDALDAALAALRERFQ